MKPDSLIKKLFSLKLNMVSSSSRTIAKKPNAEKKWTTLEHHGVIFPPPYNCHGVKILYKGYPVDLTPEQEEVATMYAAMRDTEYIKKPLFRKNFWNDWQQLLGENHVIQNLDDCDFSPIYAWHLQDREMKKQMSLEERRFLREEKLKMEEIYMSAVVDGVKEKVGNFRVEPPGLFRGRGDHPNMGKLKKRIRPCDITINIGKEALIPCPIPGERWKEVKHDNTLTWLAFWNDPIKPKEYKYVFLAPSYALKAQSYKYSKPQIGVATRLIKNLSLNDRNEK